MKCCCGKPGHFWSGKFETAFCSDECLQTALDGDLVLLAMKEEPSCH
jgi:hypothetical protein